jgi:hypothetical protein
MADDVNEYIHSGADYVLGKPVNFEDLKQMLHFSRENGEWRERVCVYAGHVYLSDFIV